MNSNIKKSKLKNSLTGLLNIGIISFMTISTIGVIGIGTTSNAFAQIQPVQSIQEHEHERMIRYHIMSKELKAELSNCWNHLNDAEKAEYTKVLKDIKEKRKGTDFQRKYKLKEETMDIMNEFKDICYERIDAEEEAKHGPKKSFMQKLKAKFSHDKKAQDNKQVKNTNHADHENEERLKDLYLGTK